LKLTRTVLLPGLLALSFLPAIAVFAQAPAPVAPVAPVAPAASKPEAVILRRTPSLDGAIEPGEWDMYLQTQQEGFSATAYANWDEAGLYVAVQGPKPTDLMVTIDANNDGWFHGKDNYLVKATDAPDGKMTPSLELYDSRAVMSAPGSTLHLDPAGIIYKHKETPESSVLEMSIPASAIQGLKLKANGIVGLRISLRPAVEGAAWTPMAALGDVEPCCLSDRKVAAVDQLGVSMVLLDDRVVAGQKLMARLYIKNTSAQAMPLDSFVVGGDGRAAKYLNSQRVRLEGLEPGKQIRHKFESRIPADMPVGSWAIGIEVKSGADASRVGAALGSFEVVKPFEVSMDAGDQPLTLGIDKDRLVTINVKNQTPGRALGVATISLPDGWRLKPNLLVRKFEIPFEDESTKIKFRIMPPADAKPGEIPIKVDLTVSNENFALGKTLVVNGQPAK
jgi:hypothetical protein